ncbi:MAG: type II toxin-antitoxin system RelE/ParE family toxin [Alphaproteobacteria bacterium]|jgi:toxin ParE1/3/4|nr:type II toxin-antitoxin system RelE/ParE family toxin [Alphaproteobacteria bacterium]MDP6815250.1 type II toxin-antitoxin system RelE/ParE family toxin [Alphaproteobacteria bacterium]
MPGFRVSKKARADIVDIGLYTQRRWGREQRRKYLSGLETGFARLADNPNLAAERTEFDPPVRIHRHERHLIVYRAKGDGILIIRVLHESMDIAARLPDR